MRIKKITVGFVFKCMLFLLLGWILLRVLYIGLYTLTGYTLYQIDPDVKVQFALDYEQGNVDGKVFGSLFLNLNEVNIRPFLSYKIDEYTGKTHSRVSYSYFYDLEEGRRYKSSEAGTFSVALSVGLSPISEEKQRVSFKNHYARGLKRHKDEFGLVFHGFKEKDSYGNTQRHYYTYPSDDYPVYIKCTGGRLKDVCYLEGWFERGVHARIRLYFSELKYWDRIFFDSKNYFLSNLSVG